MMTKAQRKEDVRRFNEALQRRYAERRELDRRIDRLESELWIAADPPTNQRRMTLRMTIEKGETQQNRIAELEKENLGLHKAACDSYEEQQERIAKLKAGCELRTIIWRNKTSDFQCDFCDASAADQDKISHTTECFLFEEPNDE